MASVQHFAILGGQFRLSKIVLSSLKKIMLNFSFFIFFNLISLLGFKIFFSRYPKIHKQCHKMLLDYFSIFSFKKNFLFLTHFFLFSFLFIFLIFFIILLFISLVQFCPHSLVPQFCRCLVLLRMYHVFFTVYRESNLNL